MTGIERSVWAVAETLPRRGATMSQVAAAVALVVAHLTDEAPLVRMEGETLVPAGPCYWQVIDADPARLAPAICGCPDYATSCRCEHIVAVELLRAWEAATAAAVTAACARRVA